MEWTQLTHWSGLEASSLAKTDSAVEALRKIRELFARIVENQTDTLDDLLAKRDLWRTLRVGRWLGIFLKYLLELPLENELLDH